MGRYRPIWARPGPLKSCRSSKNACFSGKTFFSQIVVLNLQTTFFDGKTVFFRFLAEMRLRTLINSLQKASSLSISCKFRTTCTLPSATVWRSRRDLQEYDFLKDQNRKIGANTKQLCWLCGFGPKCCLIDRFSCIMKFVSHFTHMPKQLQIW